MPDPPEQRFTPPLLNKNFVRQPLIAFEDAVYRLDLGHRRIEKIFTPSAGESVLGAGGANSYDASAYLSDPRAEFDGIVTTQRVVIQSQNGAVEISTPFDSRAAGYDEVTIYRAAYAPDKPTFIWYRGVPNESSSACAGTGYKVQCRKCHCGALRIVASGFTLCRCRGLLHRYFWQFP